MPALKKDTTMNSEYFSQLSTEKVNQATQSIDECSTREMLTLINREDTLVPRAVEKEIPHIEQAVELIYTALKNGGRLYYVGAGTSGRLGVLDASECPPTYGVEPDLVQAYIAGGDHALRNAIEGSEDDRGAGELLAQQHHMGSGDVVVGITASGAAPYVIGAVETAKQQGAKTVALVTNANTQLGKLCDVCIAPLVGSEVIAGSTRMKSGTAQKLVLNMLTTAAMIKLGKVYNNLMVDLRASNKKLHARAIRMVSEVTGVTPQKASEVLDLCGGHVKTALMMLETGMDYEQAVQALEKADGGLKAAIRSAKQ